jgi:hypothetical protein
VILRTVILVLLLISDGLAQSGAQKYESVFENDVVAVYRLELSAEASIAPVQSSRDSFWVALNDSAVTFSLQQGSAPAQLQAGDVRFFPSFATKLLINSGTALFRGVLIVLKPRALISGDCECTGNTAKAVCGCKGAGHLESLWALNMGSVTLAGTQLSAGEAFRAAAQRDDMLLVAITEIDLEDAVATEADPMNRLVHLKAGDATWIKGGSHRFKNVGSAPAKFVTFEF